MTTPNLRFLLLEVIPHGHDSNMGELIQLVTTYGGDVIDKTIQHRDHPHPATYLGEGKVEWLKETVKAQKIDVVCFNAILKPSQLFRLEKALWGVNRRIGVWDKFDLILEIFDRHAHSKEAKLQIELARLSHLGPRIYGLGGTVLSRQGGGIGTRGSGETNIEIEKRRLKDKTAQLKKELASLSENKRDRLRFRAEQGFGPVALVGYTSAGKTTLFNHLTGKDKLTHQGLFTTLDTVVGKLKIPDHHLPILISDTIGFIKDLPPSLIDAFHSTLLESLEAKLILHVIDATDKALEEKVAVVEKILADLSITTPTIKVFNKTENLTKDQLNYLKSQNPRALFISAITGAGLPQLKKTITKSLMART